jgi:hypothetical protein
MESPNIRACLVMFVVLLLVRFAQRVGAPCLAARARAAGTLLGEAVDGLNPGRKQTRSINRPDGQTRSLDIFRS